MEVKADGQGHKTGHVFIETVSVDKDGRPGWAFTCQADLLVYWLPHAGDGWVLDPAEVRDAVWGWTRKYPVRASTNPTYHSYGLLVPHRCLDMLALERFRWKERDDAVGRCDT